MTAARRFTLALACALALGVATPPAAAAQMFDLSAGRKHTYAQLRRDPWVAVGWDALLPGAGSVYVGLYANTAISAAVSLLGAALWIHGGVRDVRGTTIAGASLFGAGRAYGLVSAGVGASMLNRALRKQLQLGVSPTGVCLRF